MSASIDLSIPIYQQMGRRQCRYEGYQFGVELEAEGISLPEPEKVYEEDSDDYDTVMPQLGSWVTHEEGSITGAEYVMACPRPLDEAIAEVQDLFGRLRSQYDATILPSPRTSVHVHVNCGDKTLAWLKKALPVLAAAEPFLIHQGGRHRRGNLFCLSRQEAPFGWSNAIEFARTGRWGGQDAKYSAINFEPLRIFGSIEFRMMRGLTTSEDLCRWLSLVSEVMNAIDYIPESFDFESFPSELDCVRQSVLSSVTPHDRARLTKLALQNAAEVQMLLMRVTEPVVNEKKKPSLMSLASIDWESFQQQLQTAEPVVSPWISTEGFNPFTAPLYSDAPVVDDF